MGRRKNLNLKSGTGKRIFDDNLLLLLNLAKGWGHLFPNPGCRINRDLEFTCNRSYTFNMIIMFMRHNDSFDL
ncbi:hypothetical protein SDC9_207819 [bioreactor metagenome]|uniref:Uncharacterized protein n=1 Tax=bioreactor metagenome TaxID=1076179 RepID=A0A645JID6_9ZZZZ